MFRGTAGLFIVSAALLAATSCTGTSQSANTSIVMQFTNDSATLAGTSAALSGAATSSAAVFATPRPESARRSATPTHGVAAIISPKVFCQPGTPGCPTPNPSPIAKNVIGPYGVSPLSFITSGSSGSSYDIVLPLGGKGSLAYYCSISQNGVLNGCGASTVVT